MRKRIFCWIGIFMIVTTFAFLVVLDQWSPGTSVPVQITAAQIMHGHSLQGTECQSFEQVSFTYEVHNRGKQPVSGLKLGLSCGCEAVDPPPAVIPAGQSARISFRLKAPQAGILRRQVPLLADGSTEPLLVLEPVLRVKFDPPALIQTPTDLRLTFLSGTSSPQELVFEAIERRKDRRWITGLKLDPADVLETQSVTVEELPEADPELIRRRYHFPFLSPSGDVGAYNATATLQTSGDQARLPVSVPISFM